MPGLCNGDGTYTATHGGGAKVLSHSAASHEIDVIRGQAPRIAAGDPQHHAVWNSAMLLLPQHAAHQLQLAFMLARGVLAAAAALPDQATGIINAQRLHFLAVHRGALSPLVVEHQAVAQVFLLTCVAAAFETRVGWI